MQTIQQQRARFALERVLEAKGQRGIDEKEFKARAAELPAMIHMNGLGQSAAFYRMKGDKHEHRRLYEILGKWLCREPRGWVTDPGIYASYEGDLMRGITEGDMSRYRLAQAEALAFMDWVKKFAKAYMPD